MSVLRGRLRKIESNLGGHYRPHVVEYHDGDEKGLQAKIDSMIQAGHAARGDLFVCLRRFAWERAV